jgi:hypothetical protein
VITRDIFLIPENFRKCDPKQLTSLKNNKNPPKDMTRDKTKVVPIDETETIVHSGTVDFFIEPNTINEL